jgi:cytochrome c oxidase subunit 3
MSRGADHLRVQYQDLAQQTEAAEFGMWVFMASEVLFFSGLFTLYGAYWVEYGDVFRQASRYTDRTLGSADTFILLTSSALVALCVFGARHGWAARRLLWLLGGTIGLGVLFLVLKFTEYAEHMAEGIYPGSAYAFPDLPERGARIFFTLYYTMTGVHAVHVTVGLILMVWLFVLVRKGRITADYRTPLELVGIYWHFVDIIWVFLWPMFYLFR